MLTLDKPSLKPRLQLKKIDAIDGLRGLAIFMVIFTHTLARHFLNNFSGAYIFGFGWIGVNLFFILSGFVLAKPFIQGYKSFDTWGDVLSFYKRRFFRLYPLFLFVAAVSLTLLKGLTVQNLKSFILVVTTFSMFTDSDFESPLNPVFWSLVVEIWFSLTFPLLFFLFNRYRFVKVTATFFVIALFFRAVGSLYPDPNYNINPVKSFFLARMDDFLVGIIICKLYYRTNILARLSKLPLASFGLFFILTGCFLWHVRLEGHLPALAESGFTYLFQLGFGCWLVKVLSDKRSVLKTVFQSTLLRVPGKMCYSLYMWHYLLALYLLNDFSIAGFGLYCLVLSVLAAASFWIIENNRLPRIRSLKSQPTRY